MIVKVWLKMTVQKDGTTFWRWDQPRFSGATKAHIENFIENQAEYWAVVQDPFLAEVFKLQKTHWDPTTGLFCATIRIQPKAIPDEVLTSPPQTREDAALSILYKFAYTTWMRDIGSSFEYHLRKTKTRAPAFSPTVTEVVITRA